MGARSRESPTQSMKRGVPAAGWIGEERLLQPVRGDTQANGEREQADHFVGVGPEEVRAEDPARVLFDRHLEGGDCFPDPQRVEPSDHHEIVLSLHAAPRSR